MTTSPVVVTGLGAATPVGGDVEATWSALLAGKSGVVALTEDWASELPVRIAAPVDPSEVLERSRRAASTGPDSSRSSQRARRGQTPVPSTSIRSGWRS
jgi:3-oxoacyl-(acyl-carrier-protein) synthase